MRSISKHKFPSTDFISQFITGGRASNITFSGMNQTQDKTSNFARCRNDQQDAMVQILGKNCEVLEVRIKAKFIFKTKYGRPDG